MARQTHARALLSTLVTVAAAMQLAACGGGDDGGSSAAAAPGGTQQQTSAPAATTPATATPATDPQGSQTQTPSAPAPAQVTQPTVNAATLQWVAPTENTDGTALTDLAGFRIMYGSSPDALTQTLQISNPSISMYVMDNLPAGTHYFAIRAYTANGAESSNSQVASKVIS